MSKIDEILTNIWDNYKNGNRDIILNPFSYLIEQRIFIKLDRIGEISDLEKTFLIDYMKSGVMDKDEMLDYEDLRRENPTCVLPEVDF